MVITLVFGLTAPVQLVRCGPGYNGATLVRTISTGATTDMRSDSSVMLSKSGSRFSDGEGNSLTARDVVVEPSPGNDAGTGNQTNYFTAGIDWLPPTRSDRLVASLWAGNKPESMYSLKK